MVISFYPASAGFFIVKIYDISLIFSKKNPQNHHQEPQKVKKRYFFEKNTTPTYMSKWHFFYFKNLIINKIEMRYF